ncbi:hypothetical protein IWZ03DRAFT_421070 [Phyllosticta citriasiana]|uniref:Uncharacterized protein n=1 Tax=Phyllosticta citriasiana TaxID=595635 RepID=A0ABR1KUQ3_9PEZI
MKNQSHSYSARTRSSCTGPSSNPLSLGRASKPAAYNPSNSNTLSWTSDSLPVVYGQTMFKMVIAGDLEDFVKIVGADARFVKDVSITEPDIEELHNEADFLSNFGHLNRLELAHHHDHQETYASPIATAEEFYNTVPGWIEAAGVIKGNKYASLDVVMFKDCSATWNAEFRVQLKFYIGKRRSSFPFLRMPQNVRQDIHELAMTDQSDYTNEHLPGRMSELQPGGIIDLDQKIVREDGARIVNRHIGEKVYRTNSVTPEFLQVNRFVYEESLPILYSKNTFLFSYILLDDIAKIPTMMELFLNQIGASAAYIKRLAVERLITEWRTPPNLIHLEKLYVPVTEGPWKQTENPIIAARNFFSRQRQWIEGVASF